MGTRSLTFVYDEQQRSIINMYRQFDGYPSGHGAELAEFLNGFQIVNGFGEAKTKLANGMGCLAAQIIAHFKVGIGGFYLESVESIDCGQDYTYHIYDNRICVENWDSKIFDGTWEEFFEFCTENA